MLLGLVPEYEEREAAITSGYTWAAWQELPLIERAAGVAFARLKALIEANVSDAIRVHSELESRRAARKRGA